MTIKTPKFWYTRPGLLTILLWPISALYAAVVRLRFVFTQPVKLAVPVICVGNVVVGGAGKTPTAIKIANLLKEKGLTPHILSRGYGGKINWPTLVNPDRHKATEVGDEPLLLARVAPTWVSKDRVASAKKAITAGANVLIMDDGFQNPTIHKDISLLVIDGQQGLGNGCVFPAGPLREPTNNALKRASLVVIIGPDKHNLSLSMNVPVVHGHFRCFNAKPTKALAFTGLGYPKKFFETLVSAGYELAKAISFPDHHPYSHQEIESLIDQAKTLEASLVTTEKDMTRIPAKYAKQIETLPIELEFENNDPLMKVLGTIS